MSLMSGRARVEIASRAHDDGADAVPRAAAVAHVNSRLGRVLASCPRGATTIAPASSAPGLEPGAQVYIFHHPNPCKHAKRWWTERWVGPALVVSSERNAIWVIFRRRLLKVAKTHIRAVSDLERVDWSSLVESAFGAAGGNKGAGQSSWHHPSSSDVQRKRAREEEPENLDDLLDMYAKHVLDARPGYDDRLIAAPAPLVPTYPPTRFRFKQKTQPLPKHFHMPESSVIQQDSETAQDAGNAKQEDDLMLDRLEPHGTY
eukprot:920845-Amphidinium_carterae.4